MNLISSARYTLKERLLAVAQLMRLANVFTAIADVWMGFLLVMGSLQPILLSLGLTLCSGLLYTAGMVLNDVADYQVDAAQRPERPIPSGRISLRWAQWLGWNLLLGGLLTSFVMSFLTSSAAPALLAWGLSLMIIAYNSQLKHSWLGPLALAACRAANVLLGMSPLIIQLGTFDFLFLDIPFGPAVGIGCYVCGFSFIAQKEHAPESRGQLGVGCLLVAAGLAILATAPWWEFAASHLVVPREQWLTLWICLAAVVLRKFIPVLRRPAPKQVQHAVGYAILLLIPIDAALCWGYAGWEWAAVILALLIPAKLLSRWLYVT